MVYIYISLCIYIDVDLIIDPRSSMSVSRFLRAAKNAHKTRRTLIVRTGVKQPLLRRQIALAQNATRGAATVIESSLAIRLHATILCARRAQPVEVATNT